MVIGRKLPSEKDLEPKLYRLRIFHKNEALARSKFWHHMKRQHKVRRVQGEIVNVSEVSKSAQPFRSSRREPTQSKTMESL